MEKIIQNLKEILTSNLITVSEYGKQEKQHLIILQELNSEILQKIKPTINNYYNKTKKYPLLLTKEELLQGLDVFPLEFLNIQLNHKVIYGEDLFKNLKFKKRYIRRELEFEFRSKLINLRQGYLEVKSNKELKIIIEKAIPTILPILNGLLFLKNTEIPESLDEIFNLIQEKYKVDISILKKIETNVESLEASIKELIMLLSTLGKLLDKMEV